MAGQPTFEAYFAQFGDCQIPDNLVALWTFATAGTGYFAEGFELNIISKDGLRTWSQDLEFLNGVIEFAFANSSGSTYGFWVAEQRPLEECPIVAFGDEGGEQVVAENLRSLLRLLSYDAQLLVDHDGAYYYREEADLHSKRHDEYVSWLRDVVQVEPVRDPDPLISAARDQHQQSFAAWVNRFVSEEH